MKFINDSNQKDFRISLLTELIGNYLTSPSLIPHVITELKHFECVATYEFKGKALVFIANNSSHTEWFIVELTLHPRGPHTGHYKVDTITGHDFETAQKIITKFYKENMATIQ